MFSPFDFSACSSLYSGGGIEGASTAPVFRKAFPPVGIWEDNGLQVSEDALSHFVNVTNKKVQVYVKKILSAQCSRSQF